MNSRQRRKLEAEIHNKHREELKALELDKKENPEKYQKKRRVRTRNSWEKRRILAYATIAAGLGVNSL